MKILVVGAGKLANTILSANLLFPGCETIKWELFKSDLTNEKALVVHAGSGRQLRECINFCERTGSVFIELSTGLSTETMSPKFPLIVCPNTSILLLKAMYLIRQMGSYFRDEKISILESHQETKQSVPGTAYNIAESFDYPVQEIKSIRDPEFQTNQLGIPEEFLDKHAYHKIVIGTEKEQVTIETKILGHDSYSEGVKKIIKAALEHPLENRRYSVLELIDRQLL